MSQYILQTIPANPTAPITAEWLREVGFTEVHDSEEPDYIILDDHGSLRMKVYQVGDVYACEEPNWPDDLHCRKQVVDIMSALGLQPKGDV